MEWLRRIARRWNRADPIKADAVIAALFIAWGVLEAFTLDPEGDSRVATAVFGTLAMTPLAFRRLYPLPAVAAFVTLGALQEPLFDSFLWGRNGNSAFVAALFFSYSTGRHLEQDTVWRGAAILVVGLAISLITSGSFETAADVVWIFVLMVAPLLAGQAIRSRVLLRKELREKAERLDRDRERLAMEAVEDERTRIASELQVVVANGVSAMVVQAEAVPLVLGSGDTERAKQAFQVIEETGRDALAEMRRLLGVLRRDGERPELAPLPGLARLDTMVAEVRDGGLRVDLAIEGQRRELPPGVDLTAFRTLQETLAAAVTAEAGHASVTLRYGPRDLELEIRDDRGSAADAEAVVSALRERISLYEGHVRGWVPEDGGYAVEARLPAGTRVGAALTGGGS